MSKIYDLVDTWNDSGTTFTAIKMNVTDTASDAASLLMDLQVGGRTAFSVNKTDGAILRNFALSNVNSKIFEFKNWDGTFDRSVAVLKTYVSGGRGHLMLSGLNTTDYAIHFRVRGTDETYIGLQAEGFFGWASSQPQINLSSTIQDLRLYRDAADTLAQRNGTNAQTFNLYNTYTDGSNYERASFTQTATGLVLDSQYIGTGTEPDNILELKSGGVSRFRVNKQGQIYRSTPPDTSGCRLKINTGSSDTGIADNGGGFHVLYNSVGALTIDEDRVNIGGNRYLGFINIRSFDVSDLRLYRDAANTLAQRNSTNPQTFNLYNTYTDGSNYERASFTQTATGLVLDAQYAGTGTEPNNILELKSGGTSKFRVEKNGTFGFGNSQKFEINATGINVYSYGSVNAFFSAGSVTFKAVSFHESPESRGARVLLFQDGTNGVLQQRGSASAAAEYRLFGAYTSATDYQRLSTKSIKEAVTAASGASVTTTISIPKYSQLIGVTTRVTTDLGDSNGTTGYTVGDGTDADLWGDVTGITAGTTSDAADFTAVGALGAGTADRTITLTATGGNFDGTGVIEVCAFYLRAEAD